ncbi:prolyl oligopeptidase family serine peptidase [Chitinophaga sp. MM2321]|uniref:alpha/beta hydrolase family protein n=1 Tax=Chitinophaga sp. MM2321 TaxID=3137178 RepID=UPI0032D57407
MEIERGEGGQMTADSRKMIFKTDDSLGIVKLGNSNIEYIPHVISFKLPNHGKEEWLAYQLNNVGKELVLCNLLTNCKKYFKNVKDYKFTDDGRGMLLRTELKKDSITMQSLKWVDLIRNRNITIWEGMNADGVVFDSKDSQLAFTAIDAPGIATISFWYYRLGADKAIRIADDNSSGIKENLELGSITNFSEDGKSIFFNLREKSSPISERLDVMVDIWSYIDPKLQSQQLNEISHDQRYEAVIHLSDNSILQLEHLGGESLFFSINSENKKGFVLLRKGEGDLGNEWNWNKTAQSSVYLVSIKDGSRRLLNDKLPESIANSYQLSPEGKFVVYYSATQKDYFAYEILTGRTRNITQGIKGRWTTYKDRDIPMAAYLPIGIAGWVLHDEAVLLYDQNDIFQVDLTGRKRSVNFTNDYGRRNNIVFRLAMGAWPPPIIKPNEQLVLNAFNRSNKDGGFYSVTLGVERNPVLLTMGPYIFQGTNESENISPIRPIKAKDAEIYLVRRMSATESPNYFYTSDFKQFIPLTNLHPEKQYNWLTTELVTWKTLDGSLSQGILYKPEDFDPKKKYPVLFYYYERLSEDLHGFIKPEMSRGSINIPFYVSSGYLVFTPDIHYKIGHPGSSAVNSIVSAAEYLAKFPWVDSTRMGIQGHSRGGYQTNYVITQTNLFAAAMSASGFSDFVSLYGGVRASGDTRKSGMELRYQRIGATLWQRPDLYIENSPIFNIDKVSTPLLMMSNRMDGDIPFIEGVAFFTGLRRLGKKAWMLQYDKEDHIVFGRAAIDLTIRMKQFFDHYLKGASAPIWMTRGVSAKLKGIDNGLELDSNIRTPGTGLVSEIQY